MQGAERGPGCIARHARHGHLQQMERRTGVDASNLIENASLHLFQKARDLNISNFAATSTFEKPTGHFGYALLGLSIPSLGGKDMRFGNSDQY